jgi:hypothetical protein
MRSGSSRLASKLDKQALMNSWMKKTGIGCAAAFRLPARAPRPKFVSSSRAVSKEGTFCPERRYYRPIVHFPSFRFDYSRRADSIGTLTTRNRRRNMKILTVLTSHDVLGNTGHKTGFWLEEFAAPYFVFRDAGIQLTLASPKVGNHPSIRRAIYQKIKRSP